MKEIEVWPGNHIVRTIQKALKEAPCYFIFNGCRIEVVESMIDHKDAEAHLYQVYLAYMDKRPAPVWNSKSAEKPCKSCGRNNFITDKKCWWCETANPCL